MCPPLLPHPLPDLQFISPQSHRFPLAGTTKIILPPSRNGKFPIDRRISTKKRIQQSLTQALVVISLLRMRLIKKWILQPPKPESVQPLGNQ